METFEQFQLPTNRIVNIPLTVLKASYVRYEPYNLGITFRHPLRRTNAAAEYSHDGEGAKDIILSTYPISREQILVEIKDGVPCINIFVSLLENNVEVIEGAMFKLGYMRIVTNNSVITDSLRRQWTYVSFSPMRKINDKSLRERIQRLKGIKTMAVLSAGPIDTIQYKEFGKIRSRSLLPDIKVCRYAYVPANGLLDKQEKLYVVFNVPIDTAKWICGRYQRTSFVFTQLSDDGGVHSEYWKMKDVDRPYHKKKKRSYEMKDDETSVTTDTSDNLIVSGKQFQYQIPLVEIERINSLFVTNMNHMIEVAKKKWNENLNFEKILDYVIFRVGMKPYLYRKAFVKGFYDD